ncbi:TRP-like ion channel Pkd2 [Perkinsus chesapeaki]|uniref:TRP-like ion channel Pkd2 n=1 Tax=Perkinsus chesapeaki TaxID=330153 RepID=A0A7J6MBU2_PERCH|nr:TRP-like ion channel Pkd2 [Perkinsus chesapeaki]
MSRENPFHDKYDEFALERGTNKFLGDSVFWQHYEKIPVRFVYKAGSIEYRNLKLMLLEMIFYISIVVCLTSFLYNHIDASLEYQARQQQEHYWGQCSSDGGCRIEQVDDVTTFWQWYRESLVPLAFNAVGDQSLLEQAVARSKSTDDTESTTIGQYPSLTPAVTPPDGWLNGMAALVIDTPTETVTNNTGLDLDILGITTTTAAPTTATTTVAPELVVEPSLIRVWPEHAVTLFSLNEETIPWGPRYVGDTETNILLGPVRIRQVAVTPQRACSVQDELVSVHSVCFGPWSSKDEYKFKIAKTGTPERVQDAYIWRPSNETQQEAVMVGNYSQYTGAGYFFDLPTDIVQAFRVADDLEEWQWLDMATRAIIIELSTLNPNINIVVNTRLLFEFGPDGSIGVKQEHTPLPVDQVSLPVMLEGGTYLTLFLYEVVVTAQFVTFMLFAAGNLYKTRPIRYFTFLSLLEEEPSLRPELLPMPKEVFMPYSIFRDPLMSSRNTLSLLTLIVWLKLLKYMVVFGPFRPLVRVIERCIYELLAFALLCIVLLAGLAVSFHIVLGPIMDDFTWVHGSFYTLMFMLVRGPTDSRMTQILHEEPQLGKLLFILYIVLIAFLLMAFFFGIVLDVYSELAILSKNQDPSVLRENPQKRNPMMAFLFAYHYKLRGVSLVRDLADDEEVGGPDDQWIELRALPACVAAAWERKRRDLQFELEDSIAEREQASALKHIELNTEVRRSRGSILSHLSDKVSQRSKPGADRTRFEEERDETQKLVERADKCDRITRVQLQRLLNETPELCQLIGSGRAVEIIRKYKSAYQDEREEERQQRIARLQEVIFSKMEKVGNRATRLKFDTAASMELVSTELNEAMTEMQSVWRADMADVLEGIGTFSETMKNLTRSIEEVQLAHTRLATDLQLGQLHLGGHVP